MDNTYTHINFLVNQIKFGENNALWELIDFYNPIIEYSVKKVKERYTHLDIDDIRSESYLVFKDLCEKFDEEKSFFSYYINTRLLPYLISKIKSKYIHPHEIYSIDELDQIIYYNHSETIFENYNELEDAIKTLSEDDQKLIDLIYNKNLTQAECAIIIKTTQPAVNKRIKKILQNLRKILK